MIALLAAILLAQTESIGIPIEEIAAYRDAFRDAHPSEATPVTFLDLWNRPSEFRHLRVQISGRAVRTFDAPASGELPARVEVWIDTGNGNLVCLVYPHTGEMDLSESMVQATGTSFGPIRYQSGDSVRIAPLIVGSQPPRGQPAGSRTQSMYAWDRPGWMLATIATAIVAVFLARAFARRPPSPREATGPGVEFKS